MKKTRILLIAIACALAVIQATAQTNSIASAAINALSLRDASIQQTNQISVLLGNGIRTDADATHQATTLRALYLVAPQFQLGARFEANTFGTGDTVSGISLGVEARYLTDNLFASATAGYRRDVTLDTRKAEFGIGFGAFITENVCVTTEVLFAMKAAQGKDILDHAVVVEACYRF